MDALSADFSMLQVQLGITNSSNPPTTGNWTIEDSDVLLDALLQQKAAVSKAWVALMTIVSEEHEVHLPFWAIIPGLILIGAILFYLVNYMLWAKRENAARMHDLEDAKKHSEHGTLVELEDVWSCFKDIMLSPIPSTHKQPTFVYSRNNMWSRSTTILLMGGQSTTHQKQKQHFTQATCWALWLRQGCWKSTFYCDDPQGDGSSTQE